jgi:hypothetical protein
MKTIIAGSRSITNEEYVKYCLNEFAEEIPITEVVSGCAKGVDRIGENWAKTRKIPVKQFPADWSNLGKKAGIVRNCKMVDYADVLIAFWDGRSKGTRHVIDYALKKNLKVEVSVYP